LHRRFDRHFFPSVGSSDATLERGSYLSYLMTASRFESNPIRAVRRGRAVRRRLSPPPATIRARKLLCRPSAAPRACRRSSHRSPVHKAAHAPSPTRSRVCPRRRILAVRCRLGSPATTGGCARLQSSFHIRISSVVTLW
jgi:hypothetical protein